MQSSLVVYKFGGTSVGSVVGFLRIREIILRDRPQLIVISALSGVTDLLEIFCNTTSVLEKEKIIQKIIERHHLIIDGLRLTVSISPWIRKLRMYADQSLLSDEMRADILSVGEDMAVCLLQHFCHHKEYPVLALEAREMIKTDNQYCRANPLLEEISSQWSQVQLSEQASYIMQGFIGSNLRSQTTILGRGGSDYSAALLAEAVQAKEVRIYTDVQGVYTKDPNRFSEAKPVAFLTFKEMYHLAICGGAKVVYPLMLAPCMRAEIPIFVTSTFDPEEKGTWIFSSSDAINHVR